MFRNEAAILPPFLDQIEAFFDHAVLLNHGSSDNGPAYVRSRSGPKIELFHLKAAGYPQSAVATYFAHQIMSRHDPDFLFFLDCDEFLPFSSRSELESFLSGKERFDALLLGWLNICPTSLDGGNIFAAPFLRAPRINKTLSKIVVTRRLAGRSDWVVIQGYHWVRSSSGMPIHISNRSNVDDQAIYHIPVTSRTQFYLKIAVGAETLRQERLNLRRNQGWHWVELDQDLAVHQLSSERLTRIALHYADEGPEEPEEPEPTRNLEFSFPYIHSPYSETAESQAGQIRGLIQLFRRPEALRDSSSFTVVDEDGGILFSSGGQITTSRTEVPGVPLPSNLLSGTFADNYAALIEPLFCLPARLPSTGWAGHIPFLFVLFRALRPDTYVELGVQNGASLIAAATAAATYQTPTMLVGIDSWQGDEHTGYYQGDSIYRDLCNYFAATFPRVRLERGFFADVLPRFATGSVDILHIDGLHTYDAVKGDFTAWFDRVSPKGVIILHDIAVLEHGFGVHRLWNELKEHFTTLEFRHSFGLGVVLLSPEDERLRPLVALAHDQGAMRAYESLVADVARVLPERMRAYAEGPEAPFPNGELAQVYASASWRITAPLRRLSSTFGRIMAHFPRVRKTLRL
jgi:hypothetical protein